MKKLGTFLFLSILFLFTITTANIAQVSPDYIFGADNGSSWSLVTGMAGTAGLGSTYKWEFTANATTTHSSVRFGETSSSTEGSGFWQNNAGVSVQYTGAGAMQTAYYNVNSLGLGSFYWAITNGNYYVVKVVKQSGNDAYFAVFDNGAQAPRTITAMGKSFSNPNLLVFVSLNGAKSANEKVWVRYTTDNWATSSTIEADLDISPGGVLTNWQAEIPLAGGEIVKYYAFTTIQQAAAPAEAYADLFTVNYNNNSGVNYTYMNGNMTGTYYIGNAGTGPGGSDPEFQYLRQACDAINTATITGDCTFYITSDLTETVNIGLKQTSNFTVTFRPDADADRKITFNHALDDNAGPSGALCIGINSGIAWTDLTPSKNIVIDGYAVGGATKRLTIETAITHHGANSPIVLLDDCSNIQIKNCIIHHIGASTGSSNYAIYLRVNTSYGTKKMPSNVTIENNTITATQNTASQGIAIYANLAPTSLATGIVIQNNIINARTRGIFLYYTDNLNILGNEFHIVQTANAVLSSAVMGNNGQTGNINVVGNKFIELKSANSTAGEYGMRAIIASGGGTWYIHNNFFTGFDKTVVTAGQTMMQGIRCGSTCYIRYNTFYLNSLTNKPSNLENPTSVQGDYCAINIAAGTPEIKNNIFISNEDACFNHLIRGTNGGASDYNLMYLKAGNTNARFNVTYATFAAYQAAYPTNDVNSKSKDVNFVNAATGVLHLTGASLGDLDLIGVTGLGITTDIDGETRNAVTPYMGADENLANPLPVELSAFTATANGKNVNLTWKTATEVNSYGFEIERTNSDAQQWEKIAEVNAHGNSNAPVSYSYTDENLNAGKYSYRLKMIDNDGSFTYSPVAEATVEQPNEYVLHQNYPNPFNPVTTIQYSLPVESQVTLQIYNITGELVSTLVNEKQTQGAYNVNFDASGYASGTYIYRLVAGSFVQTKKMLLLK